MGSVRMNKEEEIKDSIEFCKDIYVYYEPSEEKDDSDNIYNRYSWEHSRERESYLHEPIKEKALNRLSVDTTSMDTDSFDIPSEEDGSKKNGLFREIAALALCVFLAFLTAKLISSYVIQITEVHGESMEATLSEGNRLFIEKLSYRLDELKRFDVIVFTKDKEVNLIKRVIGLPGEKVEIVEGTIFINGEKLQENYGLDPINPYEDALEIQLGEEEYFVLGDNRLVSVDSRYPSVGAVKKNEIVGRAFFRVYPFSEIGWIPKKEESE